MLEEYQEEGSSPGVFESQLLFSVKNVASHFPFQFSNPTFGSWYVWAYIAVTASSARLPAITFFVIINKY